MKQLVCSQTSFWCIKIRNTRKLHKLMFDMLNKQSSKECFVMILICHLVLCCLCHNIMHQSIPAAPHNFSIFKDYSRTWCFFKDLSRPKRTMIYLINPLNRSSSNELTHFLKWMKSEHVTFHLQYKHSGTFANLKNCLTPKTRKTCDPILVTLLKIRPCYSQSSRGNCNPNQRHIPISLNNPGHWSIILVVYL